MHWRAQGPWLERAERLGRRLEDGLLAVLLTGVVLLVAAQIVFRNVFSFSVAWADGLLRLAVLWLVLLGAIAASRDGRHIAIDVLSRALPRAARRGAAFTTNLFTSVISGLLAWQSARFVADSRLFGDTLLDNWPAWVFQLILPAGFAIISYRYLVRTLRQLRPGGA